MNRPEILLALSLPLLAASCGSSSSPTTSSSSTSDPRAKVAPLHVRVVSSPAGASTVLRCEGKEDTTGTTPLTVLAPIAAGETPCRLEISKAGFQTANITLDRGTLIRSGIMSERIDQNNSTAAGTPVYDPVTQRTVLVPSTDARNRAAGSDVLLPVQLKPNGAQ